jgi:pyruvate-formate lyase
MITESVVLGNDDLIQLELDPASRSFRLREMYWNKTHNKALIRKQVVGSGENTLTGHAEDFAALLEASDPFIQPDELIVGCCLAIPQNGGSVARRNQRKMNQIASEQNSIDLGYYNSHYPPGYETILRMGLAGIRDHARERLLAETDAEKRDFLRAVEISYDAACRYVERHAEYADEMAASEQDPRRKQELERISSVCRELATARPTSFHTALQLLQFTRIFGGRGCIGRFDQWMYPFYKSDIEEGKLTDQEAQELLECLWIKLNEFAGNNDSLRNIALAGQTRDGEDACNELTYMCLEASAKLMLPEPKLNVRFFPGSPRRLLLECCRVLAKGANILSIFNDEVVIPAMSRLGIPIEDVRDYCNDGCSELIMGGRGTISFQVHDSLTALRETVLQAVGAGLKPARTNYGTFDDVMADFKSRLARFMPKGRGRDQAVTFPYFAASIQDCLEKASPRGARYSIWGTILAQVGNSADGLAAIKKLIYEDRSLTWDELIAAINADYEGHEPFRQMILNRAPKYGNDEDYADEIAKEIAEYFCDSVHERACNPEGYGPKWAAGLMCFGLQRKKDLPASPDGRRQGDPTANSFSPAVGMDRSGPTAVLKSVGKVDLTKASHGSVLDIAMHTSALKDGEGLEKLVALVDSFLKMPCTATLQMNVIDRDTLLKARENPESAEYRTLIVRVWGFSAVFIELDPDLQEHVLARTEHGF